MKLELVSKTIGVGRYKNLTAEEIIEAIARHGVIKEAGKLTHYLMDNKHWSPLTHVSYGFYAETSRAISAQIFRHSSLAFQELSQRYGVVLSFEPIEYRLEHPTNRQSSTDAVGVLNPDYSLLIDNKATKKQRKAMIKAQKIMAKTFKVYNDLVDAGIAKECARFHLPMATRTTIHITGNLRNLLAFLNVRMDHHAQKEIRDLAELIGEALENELPNVFSVINWRDGLFM